MEDFDPYLILKLKRTATKEDIEKAYKKLARLNHPDRGGNEEKFKQIKLAYDILSHEARRLEYDRTGNIGKDVDGTYREIVDLLKAMLYNAVGSVLDREDPGTVDIIQLMKSGIEENRLNIFRGRLRTIEIQKRISDCLHRMKVAEGGDSVLCDTLRMRISDIDKEVEGMEITISIHDSAIDVLSQYQYRTDPKHPFDIVDIVESSWAAAGGFKGITGRK